MAHSPAFLILFLGVTFSHYQGICSSNVHSMYEDKITQLYKSVVNSHYNAALRPVGVDGKEATTVSFVLKEVEVLNVDKEKGVFTFQAYVAEEWKDARLAYNDTTVSYIPVKEVKSIWIPGIYSPEVVDMSEYPVNYQAHPRFISIHPDGLVRYAARFTFTARCINIYMPDQKEFVCPVRLAPFGQFVDDIEFQPTDKLTQKPEYYVPGYKTVEVAEPKTSKIEIQFKDAKTSASAVQIDFKFTRA